MSVVKKIQLPDESVVEINDNRINTTNPSDGQTLIYDSTSNKWVNAEVPKELPVLTNNANKILAVNQNASGVEWIAGHKPDVVYSYDPNNIIYSQSGNVLTSPVWHTLTNVDLTPYHHLMVYAVPIKNTVDLSTDNISAGMVMEVSMDSYNITSDMPYYSGGTLVPYVNSDNRLYTGAVLVSKTSNDEWQIAFKAVSLYGTSSTDVTTSYIYKIEGCYDSEIGAASGGGGGGADNLYELNDVHITSPSSGDVLKYDNVSQKWINGSESGGVTTLQGLTDTNLTSLQNTQILVYNSSTSKWQNENMRPTGLTKYEFYYKLSSDTDGVSGILLSNDVDPSIDVYDYYIEIDGTLQLSTICIDALPRECVNLYLKNTNTSNSQGITLRFTFGAGFDDYAIYDDGNITYNANHIDLNIPRNKVIEASLKKYINGSHNPVISIIYSDPLTIQAS